MHITCATDDPVTSVCPSLCLSVARLHRTNVAKQIEVLFGSKMLGTKSTFYSLLDGGVRIPYGNEYSMWPSPNYFGLVFSLLLP